LRIHVRNEWVLTEFVEISIETEKLLASLEPIVDKLDVEIFEILLSNVERVCLPLALIG